MESPWYETFFGEAYLRAYEPVFKTLDAEKQVDWLVRELDLKPGMRVLDLCCGQGRHAVPLAKRGLRVSGLDLSEALLARAAEAAKAAGVTVDLVRRDMRDIPWVGEFDAAVNLFTAFGYFEDDRENLRVLEGAARALKPGGRFVIDFINYPWIIRHFAPKDWSPGEGGLLFLQSRSIDWKNGMLDLEFSYLEKGGAASSTRSRLRLLMPHELVDWLRRADFEVQSLHGDLDGRPHGIDTPRVVVVCRKM
jgi:SAM-dependent methyltransferase